MKHIALMTGAIAFAMTVFAEPTAWFDANIDQYTEWPATEAVGGYWNGATESVTLENHALVLTSTDEALEFSGYDSQTLTDKKPTITSTVLFTAYDEDDKPAIPNGAKGGVIVCEDSESALSYWVVAQDGENPSNVWTKVTGTPSLDDAVSIAITVTESTVTYKIGEDTAQVLPIVIAAESSVQTVSYQGVGSVSALVGTYVMAERTLTIDATALAAENLVVTQINGEDFSGTTYNFAIGSNIIVTFGPTSGAYMIGATKTKTYSAVSANFTIDTRPDGVSKSVSASSNDPLELGSYDDFVAFKNLVNGGDNFEGKFVSQIATIDFAGQDQWVGIGSADDAAHTFKGTYNGNNHSLTNVTFAKQKYNGIFQYFAGTIKDLSVNMIGFDATSQATSYGAAIVGNMRLGATFNHVIATGSLKATHNVAGFACQGHMGTYIGCTNRCAIASDNHDRVAGFVAFSHTGNGTGANISTYTDCANEAAITGGENAGAYGAAGFIAMLSNGHQATFTRCVNTGVITCSNPNGHAGNLIGELGSSDTACSLTLVDCPASTTLKPIGNIVDGTKVKTFNGYFAKEVNSVLTYCDTPTTKGTYQVMQANTNTITLVDVVAGDTLTLTPTLGAYTGTVTCSDSSLKVSDPVNNVWTVEAAPTGTAFTIAATAGLTFKVDGAETAVAGPITTAPKVADDTITIEIVYDTTAIKLPVRSGTIGNEQIGNSDFEDGVYTYNVTGLETATEFVFTVADASTSDKVRPADLVPADTDPTKVETATSKLDTLAKKSSGGSADTGVMKKIAGWVNTKSIKGDAIADASAQDLEDAYLLNCDGITAEKIAAAKAAFKFPAITPGTIPEASTANGVNGTIKYLGCDNLKDWVDAAASHKFYKATIIKE